MTHIHWVRQNIPRNPRLDDRALRLLQSGAFYLHGRDKFFRPCIVMDGQVMADINKKTPELITPEVLSILFVWLHNYLRKVMFMPGQVE